MLNGVRSRLHARLHDTRTSTPEETRARLARQQADLLWALTGKVVATPGFDEATLALVATSLRVKRRRVVARAWPRLTRALGSEFPHWFDTFASEQALPPDAQPLCDGQRFAQWLHARRACPDAGLVELTEVELRWALRGGRLVWRRGPAAALRYLPQAAAWVVAIRVPLIGEWWCHWRPGASRERGSSEGVRWMCRLATALLSGRR